MTFSAAPRSPLADVADLLLSDAAAPAPPRAPARAPGARRAPWPGGPVRVAVTAPGAEAAAGPLALGLAVEAARASLRVIVVDAARAVPCAGLVPALRETVDGRLLVGPRGVLVWRPADAGAAGAIEGLPIARGMHLAIAVGPDAGPGGDRPPCDLALLAVAASFRGVRSAVDRVRALCGSPARPRAILGLVVGAPGPERAVSVWRRVARAGGAPPGLRSAGWLPPEGAPDPFSPEQRPLLLAARILIEEAAAARAARDAASAAR